MKRRNRGFTLLELMVVLIVVGILLGIAVPGMTDFIRNSRMTAAANDLVGALTFARGEAIKRRAPVTLCTSNNALAADEATPVCAASDELLGWIVFVDEDNDRARDGGEELLKRAGPPNAAIDTVSSLDPLSITWLDTGFTNGGVQLAVRMCDSRGNVASAGELSAARAVTVSPTGRPGVTRVPAEIEALGGCPE